jgi:sporulation protein YlmC with PRC-barrel domain
MWASLKLLDRQILDREGRFAGNVDDVVLDYADGHLVVTGLRSGAGALVHRLRGKRLSHWLERMHTNMDHNDGFIPLGNVSSVGNHVSVAKDAHELASEHYETWFRDHVIARIPGSGHVAE